ncbi:MAG: hypothetical protein U0942_01405 [Parvibaculum sp.]|uniref:hypothetical protein n=1 Tax=Parvibaculum sp. TaxID=2024848 RepID=UPI002AB973B6|nr:hypothetical protein [Parvibaculum sp.]MDZ4379978.1 hypothetical protein [Parvibaculum sp.]
MANAVMEGHHVLQQSLQSDVVIDALKQNNLFDIHDSNNILFLSRDANLAAGTETIQHTSDHAKVVARQQAMLGDFASRQATPSKSYGQLLAASSLTPEEIVIRDQILIEAREFVSDLRDHTAKNIISGNLKKRGHKKRGQSGFSSRRGLVGLQEE